MSPPKLLKIPRCVIFYSYLLNNSWICYQGAIHEFAGYIRNVYHWQSLSIHENGILLPKLWEEIDLVIERNLAEGWEFANFLRLLDQFIQRIFGDRILF